METLLVRDAHAWTRSSAPWRTQDGERAAERAGGTTPTGVKFGWKLVYYLSGSVVGGYAWSVREEETSIAQTRFLAFAGAAAACWACAMAL